MLPKIPGPPTSTTQSVRDHFYTILTQNYDIPAEEAESIVSKWRYGKDREVHNYDIQTYREIFGTEIGSLLHGYKTFKSAPPGQMDPKDTMSGAIGFGIMGIMFLACGWSASDVFGLMVVFGGIGLFFGTMAIGFFVAAKRAKDAEAKAGKIVAFEQDLKKDEGFGKGHLG